MQADNGVLLERTRLIEQPQPQRNGKRDAQTGARSPAEEGEVSRRFYWRILEEVDVETDGRVIAWEPSP